MITKRFVRVIMFACAVLFATYTAQAFYNPGTGRWLSRDPIEESDGPNIYAFTRNDPIKDADILGLLSVITEGYAFRDPPSRPYPLPSSRGKQGGSKTRLSSEAHAYYWGWASPRDTSICNTGLLRENPDYPSHKTSFVKASILPTCASKYRITCTAKLETSVWGRLNPAQTFQAVGHLLGEKVLPWETANYPNPLVPDSWKATFKKTVTKEVIITDSNEPYILYEVYMPVALQVHSGFRGGFTEDGDASCVIEHLPE